MVVENGPMTDVAKRRSGGLSALRSKISFIDLMQSLGLMAVILLGSIVMSTLSPVFATVRNIENVL